MNSNWWTIPEMVYYYNYLLCGNESDNVNHGFNTLIKKVTSGITQKNVLSVGCGYCGKEVQLIKSGIAENIYAYEINQKRYNRAKLVIKAAKLKDKIHISSDDYRNDKRMFDMIHWNASLHHIEDTERAIAWSYDHLKSGGYFVAMEYVGANRLQWRDKIIDIAKEMGYKVRRPSPKDPFEAVDSENIIKGFKNVFPKGIVIYGGMALCNPVALKLNGDARMDLENIQNIINVDYILHREGIDDMAVLLARYE